MSPLPEQLIDRWRDGYGAADPAKGTLYWHILLGNNSPFRNIVLAAQDRLSGFSGLHMTPLQWLHITVLIAGPAGHISSQAISEMLETAQLSISDIGPIEVEFSRVIYHAEGIVLAAHPFEVLSPIREAAQTATRAVMGHDGLSERSSPIWTPHVTLCYSTSIQPAGPIIGALGKNLPRCRVAIEGFDLVIQRGSEWLWNWSSVGAVSITGQLDLQTINASRIFDSFLSPHNPISYGRCRPRRPGTARPW